MITDERYTCEIKSRICVVIAAFNKKKTLFISKFDLNLRRKLVKLCTWNIALHGAEISTLREGDQKCFESFEMW
jgi:hypothetical protein